MVKIDEDEMENGKTVSAKLMNGRSGGLPWLVIFDADGTELATSVGPAGNVGCPVEPFEIEHFVSMIEQTCSATTRAKIGELTKALEANAKKIRGD